MYPARMGKIAHRRAHTAYSNPKSPTIKPMNAAFKIGIVITAIILNIILFLKSNLDSKMATAPASKINMKAEITKFDMIFMIEYSLFP
jgi:hypothetical protein